MPRRRKPAAGSAFEFTGEEAVAAERAFRRRHPPSARKPKISITSISPLSTIAKLLHPHSAPHSAPTTTPTKPARRRAAALRRKLKSVVAPRPPPSTPNRTPRSAPPAVDVEQSPSTPSRRSRRARVPSFKLRPSADGAHPEHPQSSPEHPFSSPSLPAKIRIRSPETPSAADPALMQHTPLGGAPAASPVLELGDSLGKRPREHPVPDAPEHPHGLAPEQKKPRSVDPEQHPPDIADQSGEDKPEHEGVGDPKHGEQPEQSAEPNSTKENATKANTTKENATKENATKENATVTKPSTDPSAAETKPSPKETPDPQSSPAADPVSALEPRPLAAAAKPPLTTTCDNPESTDAFESPVTPVNAHVDIHMLHLPSQEEPVIEGQTDSPAPGNDTTPPPQPAAENILPPLPTNDQTTPGRKTTDQSGTDAQTPEKEPDRIPVELPVGEAVSKEEMHNVDMLDIETPELGLQEAQNGISQADAHKVQEKKQPDTPKSDEEVEKTSSGANTLGLRLSDFEPPKPQTKAEKDSPRKVVANTVKRVRFTEPPPSQRSSDKKMGFSGIMKMRRRHARKHRAPEGDFGDVSVAAASAKGPDDKARHLLLDELQYLLDGIFKTNTPGSKKAQAAECQVVAPSLQSLVKLLLRKSKETANPPEEGQGQGDDCGVLVKILSEQPELLKTIVRRLCSVLGQSRASDALLSLVFVIILRGTPKLLLLRERELDLLLDAFFRNSAASLKEFERESQKVEEVKDVSNKEPQTRRRGKLGRLFDQKKPAEDILSTLLKQMIEADIVEDDCKSFKRETDAASHVLGMTISMVLCNQIEAREWMRNNRRLDKVVAVLYSCEKMMLSKRSGEEGQKRSDASKMEEESPWIVMEASMRVLEFAVLDTVCKELLAKESRVCSIIIDLLKTVNSIKTGPMESEWMICAALRLCINLCYRCGTASRQLVDGNGHIVVLNWLVKECVAAGLLKTDENQMKDSEIEESFDVRVLGLAALASIVNQETSVCNNLHDIQVEGVGEHGRGAISLILEILRTAELEAKKEEGNDKRDDAVEDFRVRKRPTREEKAERERRGHFIMERKITIGYVCLLLGALACDNKGNRELMQDLLPGKSFLGVAAVLAEFLEFHHEVGVISGTMDRMYAEIIKKLVEPETGAEPKAGQTLDAGKLDSDPEDEGDEDEDIGDKLGDEESDKEDPNEVGSSSVEIEESQKTNLAAPITGAT